jgi:hypothetical protein
VGRVGGAGLSVGKDGGLVGGVDRGWMFLRGTGYGINVVQGLQGMELSQRGSLASLSYSNGISHRGDDGASES